MTINEQTKMLANDIGLPVTPIPSSDILLAPQGLAFIDRSYEQFIIGVLLHRPRQLGSLTSVLTRFEVSSSWLSFLFRRNMSTLSTFWNQYRTCMASIPHSI